MKMPKRYPIKQNKPFFNHNHDDNVDFVEYVYQVYWSLENEKNKVSWEKLENEKKCQIYKSRNLHLQSRKFGFLN